MSRLHSCFPDFGFGNFYNAGEPLSTWCGSPPYAAPEVFEGKEYEGPQLDIWVKLYKENVDTAIQSSICFLLTLMLGSSSYLFPLQSLGVVLYVLVCGSLPFDGPSLPALRQRVTEGRFRIPFFMSQGTMVTDHSRLLLVLSKCKVLKIQDSFLVVCPLDCENLIRKMLVVDPARRISVAQIKQHRWMMADPTAAHQTLSHSLTEYNSNLGDYSEPVLGIMNTLGIDRQRTIEVTEH